ncbi:sugar nucleotide-binding protein [Chitinophaga pendula]|uniref:NAD-dependent epimerase/dehydratase family protein n=1 Tax=Chitinophaga TaxID=79328 RepID=UPI000BAFFED9|nr:MULTISPECIES: NAD-dependent epimerase/dehydratase family protein [Chitinophaga]ASZ09865.1 hypothetical protein CK934_02160 [Chitinophaga sp. MD30]UCJ07193.1 sugar nucleotide-binding protein [Chitinophaga pendula]
MKILIIGANGTIGKRLTPILKDRHDVITAARNSGDVRVDVSSEDSIKSMFNSLKHIDACICIGASGPMDNFSTLTENSFWKISKESSLGK